MMSFARPINWRVVFAYRVLHVGLAVLPIVAGVDKFLDVLGDWDAYLAPVVAAFLPVTPHAFMQAVGVVEIAVGIGVLVMPRVFAYVLAAWLWAIVLNLLISASHFDVALRDFGLSLVALALGRLGDELAGFTER